MMRRCVRLSDPYSDNRFRELAATWGAALLRDGARGAVWSAKHLSRLIRSVGAIAKASQSTPVTLSNQISA